VAVDGDRRLTEPRPGDDGGRKQGQNWRDHAAEQGLRSSTGHKRAGQVALGAA